MMKYKGYLGVAKYDDEAKVFHGEIINIRDVVTFQSVEANKLKQAFQESVEDYIAFCKSSSGQPGR